MDIGVPSGRAIGGRCFVLLFLGILSYGLLVMLLLAEKYSCHIIGTPNPVH